MVCEMRGGGLMEGLGGIKLSVWRRPSSSRFLRHGTRSTGVLCLVARLLPEHLPRHRKGFGVV